MSQNCPKINSATQGQRFDSDSEYTKRFVAELKGMPNKYLFNPWDAPKEVLNKAVIALGKDYPKPIVDIKLSRLRALEAYQYLRDQLILMHTSITITVQGNRQNSKKEDILFAILKNCFTNFNADREFKCFHFSKKTLLKNSTKNIIRC